MLSIPVIAMASISFYAGIYHLMIFARSRHFRTHLTFSILCFVVVAYDAFCIGLYNSTSVFEGAQWQKLQFISLALFVPAFLWFVADYTGQKPGRAIYFLSAFFTLAFLVQVFDRSSLTLLIDQPSIKNITLAGYTVVYYEVALGPFSALQSVTSLIASLSVLVMSVRYLRKGHQREAVLLIIATGLMYIAGFHDTLVSNGVYQFMYLMEYAYLATILMMTFSLSNAVVESAIIRDELRKREEWFRSLVETTSDWVWEVDATGRYTYASPKVRQLLGYEPEEVLGHTPFDFMHPEEAQSIRQVFQTIIQNRGIFERVENKNLRKDGQPVVLETSGIPFFSEENELLGYRGIDRDITERKEAEIALKESEEKFRSFVENSLTGIFMIDNSFRFIYVNDELCQMLEYSKDQLLGLDFREVLSENSRELVTDRYIRRQKGEKTLSRYEVEVLRRDGKVRHVEMIVNVVKDAAGRPRSLGQLIDITKRKQADQALHQSQQMLRTVLDQFPGVVFWKDRQSVYLGCNQAFATAAGLNSPMEIVGRTDLDLPWAATEAKMYQADDRTVMESGLPRLGIIEPQQQADGRLAWFDTAKVPLLDEQGWVIGILGTSRDITDQVRTLHTLQETEFFLNRSQQIARIGSYKFEVLSGTWEGSPSLDEILGIDESFLKNVDGWLSLIVPEDRGMMQDHMMRHVLTERNRFEKEYRIIRPGDGEMRWMFGSGELELDDAGNPIRMIGTIQDITERRLIENKLRVSEERLQQAIQISDIGIFDHDQVGDSIYWSAEIRRSFGISMETPFTLADFTRHLHPDDLEMIGSAIQRAHNPAGDGLFDVEYRFIRDDGDIRWIAAKSQTFFAAEEGIRHPVRTIGALIDITERKRIEGEREKLIQELEAKNAELERFTYTVSHDLKSPLVTIKGFLGYLKRDFASQNESRFLSDIDRIDSATTRMDILLRDLLELSRIGRLINPSENVPFEAVVQEAMEVVHGQLVKRGIRVDIAPNLPVVFADRRRLVEALQNLLDNATKFMGEQPSPCIEIGQQGEEDGKLVFFVKDNGVGFLPEYREHIFGLFNKLDPKTEGTGIGLALVKRIIEVHGGTVWVDSDKGKGATFYFTLPKGDGSL